MSNFTVAVTPLELGFLAQITFEGVVLSHSAATREAADQWVDRQLKKLHEEA